jgi:26S proteasome regulatory subunit N8
MREEVDVDGQLIKTFVQLPTSIEASLPEQIGVEFLLRDISDSSKSSINKIVNDKVTTMKALDQRLTEIRNYLSNVINRRLQPNPMIINNIQEIFNYLPNFETEEIIKALSNETNNNYLVLYLSWMVKSITALHKLINNKIMLKEEERVPVKKEEATEKESSNREGH